jgi:hypothetical protein
MDRPNDLVCDYAAPPPPTHRQTTRPKHASLDGSEGAHHGSRGCPLQSAAHKPLAPYAGAQRLDRAVLYRQLYIVQGDTPLKCTGSTVQQLPSALT